MAISPCTSLSADTNRNLPIQQPIRIQIQQEIRSPEDTVRNVTQINGHVDIYCWYEGIAGVPKRGAEFMRDRIFRPLYEMKKDVTFFLYSLKGWDFNKNISALTVSSLKTALLTNVDHLAIQCLTSAEFFQYCKNVTQGPLYDHVADNLFQKAWLISLSKNHPCKGKTVREFFEQQESLLNCLSDIDVNKAYSPIQYVEGYYIIHESIKRGLENQQKFIQIAFILPNDEGKYYRDYPNDIPEMLRRDFGSQLDDVKIDISFQFFQYGDNMVERPYIWKGQTKNAMVTTRGKKIDIQNYLDFMCKEVLSI